MSFLAHDPFASSEHSFRMSVRLALTPAGPTSGCTWSIDLCAADAAALLLGGSNTPGLTSPTALVLLLPNTAVTFCPSGCLSFPGGWSVEQNVRS